MPTQLVQKGLRYQLSSWATKVEGTRVSVFDLLAQAEDERETDTVVLALPPVANDTLYHQLSERAYEVHRIGDCVAPRRIDHAVYEGELAGRELWSWSDRVIEPGSLERSLTGIEQTPRANGSTLDLRLHNSAVEVTACGFSLSRRHALACFGHRRRVCVHIRTASGGADSSRCALVFSNGRRLRSSLEPRPQLRVTQHASSRRIQRKGLPAALRRVRSCRAHDSGGRDPALLDIAHDHALALLHQRGVFDLDVALNGGHESGA